jgi:virginiamycin A acetyltransferase
LLNRNARLDGGAYVGSYALIGWVWIQENSLIGSRVSIPSGGHQHRFLPSGQWTPTDDTTLTRVVIGRNTWVGEAAVVMADVGSGCMVAAGAVVSAAVPNGVMVAGNPARFVRRVTTEQPVGQSDDARVPALH